MRILSQAALVLSLAGATLAFGQSTPAPSQQTSAVAEQKAKPSEPISTYRLDYNIYEIEGGKRVNTRTYTLRLTDYNMTSTLRTGSRVPIVVGSASAALGNQNSLTSQIQYVDVGVYIEARIRPLDGRTFLATSIEMSGIAPDQSGQDPIIRANKADSNTLVTPGKTMLLASIDDSLSKRRYDVEVRVTQE